MRGRAAYGIFRAGVFDGMPDARAPTGAPTGQKLYFIF